MSGCSAHSLGAGHFPAVRKQVLQSVFSQRKCITVFSEEESVYERRRLEPPSERVSLNESWQSHQISAFEW